MPTYLPPHLKYPLDHPTVLTFFQVLGTVGLFGRALSGNPLLVFISDEASVLKENLDSLTLWNNISFTYNQSLFVILDSFV